MRPIALATQAAHRDGYFDDKLALPAFQAKGMQAEFAVWNDPSVDWSRFAGVLIRSPWDYTQDAPAFLAWLESLKVPVWNPAELVRWNLDKSYLLDLEAWDVPIPPTTRWDGTEDLDGVLAAEGWSDAVLKPMIGAGGRNTWRVTPKNAAEIALQAKAAGGAYLLQPFAPEVLTEGEWSLIYFGGRYSHAVRKRAAKGEFRVQAEWGGTVHPEVPSEELCEAADAVMESVGESVYARIDLIETADDGPWLIEAELIEPELFLRADKKAAGRLAAAVLEQLS